MKFFRNWVLAGLAMTLSSPAVAEWQAVERVEPYAISGKSGPELYASIGDRGPKASTGTSVIAHTDFKLTWTRKYEPQPDGACVLMTAKPKLIVTYKMPRPSGKLPPATQRNWDAFSAGVYKHEQVHGTHIKDMVKAIEQLSVGFSAPNDPACKTVRTELTKRLAELSLAQRQRSRDFDRVEMSDGGNVHQLILNLVNGQ